MREKPTTAAGYPPDQVARVKSTCLYLATKLTATESPDANVEFPPASHLPGDNEPYARVTDQHHHCWMCDILRTAGCCCE
jgi:hypothetical protein